MWLVIYVQVLVKVKEGEVDARTVLVECSRVNFSQRWIRGIAVLFLDTIDQGWVVNAMPWLLYPLGKRADNHCT
jgi:hypothetical protein